MATSRDIQEIISKLSSDKVKSREEGVKLLNSWMEGERSIGFCKLLDQNTAKLKPHDIPHAESWPFLLTLLTNCISLEISASKRRLPKIYFAKTLRNVIQHSEDARFSGKSMPLLSVVKSLFNHIWDVIKDVPSFQSEYGTILRHLLTRREYRFHMRKRVYNCLVLFFTGQVETAMNGKNGILSNTKEEVFRYILTLHSLLENPPGDFPDNLREGLIKGFIGIFSHLREEGKISRKLIECVNAFLLKDGPNLGSQSMEIYSAMKEFIFCCWLSTHDRGLKNALFLYARIQLKLNRSVADGSLLVEFLLDVVSKELDQNSAAGISVPWSEAGRDEKVGALANSQRGLMELASSVFYQACVHTTKASSSEKRLKRESAATCLRDGLLKGKWLWIGAFCFLIRNYGSRISKTLVSYWFEGICESFERILNDANRLHAYDALLWALRSLQELLLLGPLPISEEPLQSPTSNLVKVGWHTIWSSLMHGLPVFSNVTTVTEAALILLGRIMANDLINVPVVPQDVWDLRVFKHITSAPALYFIACYFSRQGCQGDFRDVFYLRQSLLRAIFGWFNLKESLVLNERIVMLLPAAIFSLCAGCTHFPSYSKKSALSNSFIDVFETDDWTKKEEYDQELLHEFFDCSVEVLAQIHQGSCAEVKYSKNHRCLRLPRQIRNPLTQETEDFLITVTLDQDIEKLPLSEIFFLCAMISNFIYVSTLTRHGGTSAFLTRILQRMLELLEYAVSVIQEKLSEARMHGCLGSGSIDVVTVSTLASVRILICSPFFITQREKNAVQDECHREIIQVIERLLLALAALFEENSKWDMNLESQSENCSQTSYPMNDNNARIMDMELDIEDKPKDADTSTTSGKHTAGISLSFLQMKLDMLSTISCFFSVLPDITWEIMFDLMRRENDSRVYENILQCLCRHFPFSTGTTLLDLVNSMNGIMEVSEALRFCCANVVTAIRNLLGALQPLASGGKDENVQQSGREKAAGQNLAHLGDLVNRVAEIGLVEWSARVELIDCVCSFVMLNPRIAQDMIERLLAMLQDTDYRVRLFLARRIGVLFQTWDGHNELFQDTCSNFGVMLVMSSKERPVTAKEVLAAGNQSSLNIETAIVTLAHIAIYSERLEPEAAFMMSVVAAIYPCQRELVYALLDNLSSRLQYASRSKYLDQIMGSILSCWVACGVSLTSLVEIRDLFIAKSEPDFFMQHCCPWLLPALILGENNTDLNWVSTVTGQPLAALVKNYFVPIFAVCMALHNSKKPEKEKGAVILHSSILHLADISEHERDELIKKQMVTTVSFLFSLSSSESDPIIPFFSVETIALTIQTIVDGFLEIDDHDTNAGVVDKIHIFRSDRVFKFIAQMHYQIAAAVHPRHRCHRLSGIEVLINVIGHRVAVPSTCCYLFNLVGQFIGCQALQDQCCLILSKLLETFNNNATADFISVLGEQLPFLVSRLVTCSIPSDNNVDLPIFQSSKVLSLLEQLTLDADPALHDHIRLVEKFGEERNIHVVFIDLKNY